MYYGTMATITPLPLRRTDVFGRVRIYSDYAVAVNEFVIAPVADHYGIISEAVVAHFDTELLFEALTSYDSINGNEGYRLRAALEEDAFLRMVEEHRI
jgi:hypothetical protein